MRQNCVRYLACAIAFPLIGWCVLAEKENQGTFWGSCGENKHSEKVKVAAKAHKLELCQDALVYTRDAHAVGVIKNFVAFDQ